MKAERTGIILFLLCGALIWTLDSLIDSLFFHEGTFQDLFILKVPADEIVHRGIYLALLIALGFFVSRFKSRVKKSEEVVKRLAELVEHSSETMHREYERFMRHELKNLLVPIKGYTELLQLSVSSNMDPTQTTYARRILEGANRAINLIDSLKKLHDIESGTCELERIEFPLDTIVHDAICDLTPMANENGVVIECACRDKDLAGLYDVNFMPGVFHNLIKNAIEHVCECEKPDDKVVHVTHYREDRYAVVKINNRGKPVPPEKLETFFEKFNTDRKMKSHGTGLGTTYAYLVTVAHGGTISVESSDMDGTTVTVRFKLHPEPCPA